MILRYFLPLFLFTTLTVQAQNIITFEAREAQTSAAITPDSVYIRHDGTMRDTTLIGVAAFDLGTLTGSVPLPDRLPALELGMPAPTVFDQLTRFTLTSGAAGAAALRVYTISGQLAASWSGELAPGKFVFEFDASSLPPGIYIITAATQSQAVMRKSLKLGSGLGSGAAVRLVTTEVADASQGTKKISAERWTFIGYAAGYQPDTLASVEAKGGDRFTFLMTAEPAGMKLSTGRLQPAGSWQVQPQGGSISVDKPGSPVHGITITIPDSAHGETRQYDVSYADITRHTLGSDVRIITPLIQVSNGGGYAHGVIIIRIPVSIPADEFAMAFLYNEKTGEIEGMPLLDEDANGLTVATRHFGTSSVAHSGFRKANTSFEIDAVGNLFVASVKESFLTKKAVVSSGYDVGRDDWEFTNRGSIIAPPGHCAGQSITSMWYYYEKRLVNPPSPVLFHQFDKINKEKDSLWMDNPRGYKFASIVQNDIDWDNWLRHQILALGEPANQHLGYRALLLAMSLTGEPQYLRVSGFQGAHAIVAYRVNVSDSTVSIADPNHPGIERTIQFKNGYFEPFSSKLDASDKNTILCPNIGYLAKTSLIDWDKIGKRWTEFENKTIGTIAPHQFPVVTFLDVNGNPLPASFGASADTLVIDFDVTGETGSRVRWNCWDEELHRAVTEDGRIVLRPGQHDYGFFVDGEANTGGMEFVDFQWFRITSRQPTINKITPSPAKRGEVITISGSGFGDDMTKGDVSLDDTVLPEIIVWSDTSIQVRLPINAQQGMIAVRRESSYSNKKVCTITIPLAINSFYPTHGYPGDTIAIRGEQLTRVLWVFFGPERHLSEALKTHPGHSDTLIYLRVPGGCIEGTIKLFRPFVADSIAVSKEIFSMDPPVGSASPVEGKSGTVVTIIGDNLGGNIGNITARVTIGGIEQQITGSWTRNRIDFYARNSGQIEFTVCGTTWKGPVFTLIP